MKHPNGGFKKKPCRVCKTEFQPEAPSNLYCSDPCKLSGNMNAYYMRNYGASLLDVRTMFKSQDNKCALCFKEGFKMADHHRVTLVLDHDHETGRYRQLLCHNCNRALGLMHDNPELLRRAAFYIEAHREGATTIPKGSTLEAIASGSARPPTSGGEDIVWTRRKRLAAERRVGA